MILSTLGRKNFCISFVTDQAEMLLKYCSIARTSKEIMEYLHLTHCQHFRDAILDPLITSGKLKRTIPDKPSSSNQQYVATGDVTIQRILKLHKSICSDSL